ncbi:hypothetical protein [Jannaschia marina]|uniref:hypothetical protein n=1 Tax=Jannaschia marina TaxID=2741674 RepID=UPI0015CCE927|nr:hypothetical protein [Jannaschia marina]
MKTKAWLSILPPLLIGFQAEAATVSCNFFEGAVFDSELNWVGVPSDNAMFSLMSEELSVELDNSLLAQLDTGKPFFVSEHRKGKIYIAGSDAGVLGKMVSRTEDGSTVWDGFCQVGFG